MERKNEKEKDWKKRIANVPNNRTKCYKSPLIWKYVHRLFWNKIARLIP